MIDFEKYQTLLSSYKNSFTKHWKNEKYKWEAAKCFQDNWNIDADDFVDMFERATEEADNLLTSARTFPRGMITEFAKADTEATKSMFRNLFDESQDLSFRVEAFRKSSDEIQTKYGNGRWKNHYQNTNAISTYLWLKYPDKYYVYKFGVHKSTAEQLGADYIPKADGSVSSMLGGYRMYDEICTELQKDEELREMLQDALTPECYPDPDLKTLTIDFGHYISAYYPSEQNNKNTESLSQFKWIDFYSEFATKLLEYKDDRTALIEKIQRTYKNINMSLPKLESNGIPVDIDPFTVFGLLNVRSDEDRKTIIKGLKSEFSIEADVTDDFSGVPYNQHLMQPFYSITGNRKDGDIDNLWAMFEIAITFAEDDSIDNRKLFCESYDQVRTQWNVALSLTAGLYWIRPFAYLNLDYRIREVLKNPENLGPDIASKITNSVPSGEKYLDLRDTCLSAFSSGDYLYTSFPELSYKAWNLSTQSVNYSDDLSGWEPSADVYTPGFTVEQWLELLNDKEIIGPIWGGALAKFYLEPNGASCKMLGQKYNVSSRSVLARINQLAQHIHDKTKCPLYQGKYWPTLFVGRKPKPGEEGTFIWKLRPELYEAMSKTDILKYLENTETNILEEDPASMTDDSLFSKNIILYGPPGTGKTYNTVIYAVAICEARPLEDIQAEAEENYQDVLSRFNTLKAEGRIAFTTFHQSYGYEEFIEGIKPDLGQEGETLGYVIENGLFKEFCNRAKAVKVQPATGSQMKEQPRIWGMILGGSGITDLKKQCFANNEIRLGWTEVDDNDIDGDFVGDDKASWNAKHMVFDFKNSMEVGDVVVIEKNNKSIDAIGVITGEYVYDESQGRYPRSRSVEWLVKDIDQDMVPFLPNGRKQLSRFSLFAFDYIGMDVISQILNEYMDDTVVEVEQETKPYVFIIDEINRGNISKIFGELITLIEYAKRAGASEAMDAKLPYSGESFSVPKNVYILGTMNTADRSIALMDTALRRRFDFEEMMPDTDILKGTVVVGKDQEEDVTIEIDKMLEKINQRIEILYDREHMIGHAYFIKLKEEPTMENLQEIFLNRIIPLLQEYFYDDWEKIQLVLGDNDKSVDKAARFIVDDEIRYRDFFRGKAENDEFDGKKVFRINKDAFSNPASYKKIYE